MFQIEFTGDTGKVAFNRRNGQRKEFQLNVLEVTMYLGAANVSIALIHLNISDGSV